MINNKPRAVMYSLPEHLQERVRLFAAKHNVSRSFVVKVALNQYLASNLPITAPSAQPTQPAAVDDDFLTDND